MMENRDTQKKNIVIPWKHVEPQGAGHPFWGFVSTQVNRRHSQTTNTKYPRLRKMIVANRAVERDNKTVLSIQTKKGSLNSRKYCCFVVYFAKFLGSCTQRKQDIWKWKAEKLHTDKLRRWKTWRPVLCGTQEEFAGWKSLGTERGKWRADRAAYPEGTEEGGRMITLPAMATTVPAGHHGSSWPTVVPEGHQSTLGWWEDLDVFFSLPQMSVIQTHHGLWNWWVLLARSAQSRAINRQSQVHLGQKSKEKSGWRNKIRKEREGGRTEGGQTC